VDFYDSWRGICAPGFGQLHMLSNIRLSDGLTLRPAAAADRALQLQLFASAREHLLRLPMASAQIAQFIEQQFQLQQAHYARQWPHAKNWIVQCAGRDIGYLTLSHSEDSLHIVDIALDPGARGKGYGTAILRALQAAAEQRCIPLSLSVDRQNPRAKNLYQALGFQISGTSTTHQAMLWQAPAAAGSSVGSVQMSMSIATT